MKILYVVEPRKTIGGGVRAIINLANKLLELFPEHEIIIYGVYSKIDLPELNNNVTLYRIDTLNPFSIKYLKKLIKTIKNVKPNVIHTLGLYSAFITSIITKRIKLICTLHRASDKFRYKSLLKKIIPYLRNRIDKLTFLTNYQKNHYLNRLNLYSLNSEVIPNVISIKEVNEEYVQSLKINLKTTTNRKFILGYVGRIIESKNLELFIKIVKYLNSDGYSVGVFIVGNGDQAYIQKIKNYTKELELTDTIIFEGYTNFPELYISASDLILFPTKTEALPNLLIESFSMAKLVIMNDIPQIREVVNNNENAYLITDNDVWNYTKIIKKLISQPALRRAMESNAFRTYNKYYSPEKVAKQYLDIYLNI